MVTIGDALRNTIADNYGVDGGGGTKPAQILNIVDNRQTPPYRPTTEFIAVWLPIPCRRDAVNDNYSNVTCHLMVRISTAASDDRLKVIVDEVRKICGLHAISGVHAQSVIAEDDVSNRRVPVYMMDLTVELTSNMVLAGVAYEGITYEGHTHSHDTLTNVTANQHHAQAHTLASHSSKDHSELTDVTSDQHHPQSHTHDGDTLQLDGVNSNGGAFSFNTTGGVLFNQWFGTTGSQVAIRQSGGAADTAELLMGGNRVAVGYDGAGSLFLTGKVGKQVKMYSNNTLAFRVDVLQDAFFSADLTATGDFTAANIITAGNVDGVDVSAEPARISTEIDTDISTHAGLPNVHHAQSHILSGADHTASGLTVGHVIAADSATTFSWQAQTGITSHDLTGVYHTESGLNIGHFLKADTATTFSWQAHGLNAGDVNAYTTSQVDTAIDTDITTHAGLPSVHHTKTTTIGDLTDHNKTNHDLLGLSHDSLSDVSTSDHHGRYADSEAVSAVTGQNPLSLTNALSIGSIVAGTADYDKFLVSHTGLVKYRTGAQVLSDIGGAASTHSHTHASTTGRTANDHHNQNHALIDTTGHTVSGLTGGHFLKALTTTTYGFAAHGLGASDVGAYTTAETDSAIDTDISTHAGLPSVHHNETHDLTSAVHTDSGLTAGHFLKATSVSAFAWQAHGLSAGDVSAEPSGSIATHAGIATAHQDAPALIATHATDNDAHHTRYANSEAVAAVVAQNPLTLTNSLRIGGNAVQNSAGQTKINFGAPNGFQLTPDTGDNLEMYIATTNSDIYFNINRGVYNTFDTGVRIQYGTGTYHYLIDDGADSHSLHLWSRNALKISAGTSEVVGIELNSSAEVVKIGQDTPTTNQYLQWDGSKVVWTSVGAGGPGAGTSWDLPVWDATGSALTDSMVSQNSAGTACTIGGSVALSAGTSVNDIDTAMAASPTDNQLLTAQGIQEFIYKHNNIGSGNSDWINCPYEGSDDESEDRMKWNGCVYPGGAGEYFFSVPLPTTRSGKSLYINGTRVSLAAANSTNRVDATRIFGMGNTTMTILDTDSTSKQTVALHTDTSMNVNCSGYDAIKIHTSVLNITADAIHIQYVTVRYYYA